MITNRSFINLKTIEYEEAREEIEATQLTDLKEIVQFAYDNSPYYKRIMMRIR